jgi:hypothetical protein
MVVVYGEARLDWGVADKVKDIFADVDKEGLKAAADETGSVPMERRSMGIPS